MAVLENPDFIDLQQTYLDSRAQFEFLEAEYMRQQHLSREDVSSKKKLQQSKADYLSMQSRLQASEMQLRLLGVNAESLVSNGISPYIEIKAPISGYVSNVQLNIGRHIQAEAPLCDIIDKSQFMIRLIAYEKDLSGLTVGQPIRFSVNGLENKTFHARLISIGQEVNEADRFIEIYAEVLDSNAFFRPGMYVSASIEKE